MTATIVPASLQNIGEADQIGVDIGVRISERVSHARLRGQMDDHGKPIPREQRRYRHAIRHIKPFELEARVVAKDIEPGRLQPRIVIGVEIIDPDDAMTGLQQSLRHVESDEARGPRYQNCLIRHHACILNQYQYATDFGRPTPQYRKPFRSTSSGE